MVKYHPEEEEVPRDTGQWRDGWRDSRLAGLCRQSEPVAERFQPGGVLRPALQPAQPGHWNAGLADAGPDDAADVVRGDAVDLCLLVTQRRHRDDVELEVVGPAADEWVGIAQAFAGGPGPGRAPLP